MSAWSLTLDRDKRNPRRPPTYNDKNKWKEILNDDENTISKKKRGRPKANAPELTADGQPVSQPKRRGRPPKYPRPPADNLINNNFSKSAADEVAKKTKPKSQQFKKLDNEGHKSASDSDYYCIEYAYEYEYEYSDEVEEKILNKSQPQNSSTQSSAIPNAAPANKKNLQNQIMIDQTIAQAIHQITQNSQNIPSNINQHPVTNVNTNVNNNNINYNNSNPTNTTNNINNNPSNHTNNTINNNNQNLKQLSPKTIFPAKISSSPTKILKRLQKTKSKTLGDSFSHKDEAELYVIQEIIGQKESFIPQKNQQVQYLVKFVDRAFIHCRYINKIALIKYDGGELALKKYLQKCENHTLIPSLSIPSLMIFPDSEISTRWFEVDRIFWETKGNDNNVEYFVKWNEMEYDASSIERAEDFQNSTAISLYKERHSRMNPRKIPTKWLRPNISQLVTVTERPVSKNGDVFKDFQMEGLNWLIKCWYEHRFNIFGDEIRIGKIPQLVQMLVFLSKQFGINGPYLVLVSQNQIPIWKQQFELWSNFNVVIFAGIASSRQLIIEHEMDVSDEHSRVIPDFIRCDVIITTYENFLNFNQHFVDIEWRYLIADDGYKMRNSRGRIRNLIKQLSFEHITLTMEWEMMKQNNIYKIYFLMNFIDQKNFGNFNEFCETYQPYEGEKVDALKKAVEPYFLSRDITNIIEAVKGKEEVKILIEPSKVQKHLYTELIKKRTEILMKPITDEADIPLIELISSLREIINHPILCREARDQIDEKIINSINEVTKYNPENTQSNQSDEANKSNESKNNSSESKQSNDMNGDLKKDLFSECCGKMHFVAEMLPWLIKSGHRVMIFSQPVQVLEMLEEYIKHKEYEFERIDSMTTSDDCQTILKRYITNETPIMLFSSKPGSHQIDLNIFDEVIIYDNDSFFFQREMRGTLYKLVTNGSYEMSLNASNARPICFDEEPLQYCSHGDFRPMDAEDIELMLRDSIAPMFSESEEVIIDEFFAKNIDQMLSTCQFGETPENQAVVDITKQKQFWNEFLKPPPQQKPVALSTPDSVTRARQLIHIMIDRGYIEGDEDQLDLLKCALTLAPPENSTTLAYLNEIVGDNSSDGPVRRFGGSAFLIDKMAVKLFSNVIFFARLRRALYFAAKPEIIWPNVQPSWKEPAVEYAFLYSLSKYGLKQLPSMFEEAKELKKLVEKRAMSLIEDIEKQFGVTEGFPTDFTPISPEEWENMHPNSNHIKTTLNSDEIMSLFDIISQFGIPLLKNDRPNINKIASLSQLTHIAIDTLDNTMNDVLKLALAIPNDEYEQTDELFARYKNALPIKGKVSNSQYRNLVLVCRLMEKVYSYLNSYEYENPSLYEKITLPENLTINDAILIIKCATNYGLVNVQQWEKEGLTMLDSLTKDFPNTPEGRLKLVVHIVELVRRPNTIIKASSTLEIFNYGRIVDIPEFHSKQCPYPIGFYSKRFFARSIEKLPQTWYRCEIQAVGTNPVFIVSPVDQPDNEFIEITPTDAWKRLISSYIGLKEASDVMKKSKLSGEWLYGLNHPNVLDILQQRVKDAGIKWGNDSSDGDSDDVEYKPNL